MTEVINIMIDLFHYSIACIVFKSIQKYLIEKGTLCK